MCPEVPGNPTQNAASLRSTGSPPTLRPSEVKAPRLDSRGKQEPAHGLELTQAAVSTCGAAEKLASRVWRNVLPGRAGVGSYYGRPSKALPTAGQIALSNNTLPVSSLTGQKGRMSASGTSAPLQEAMRGDQAKGRLSQWGLLKPFQQKAGEGAWRSRVPRYPTVQIGKPGPEEGGGVACLPLRLLSLTALWDRRSRQSRKTTLLPEPTYLTSHLASKSFSFIWCSQSGLEEVTIISESQKSSCFRLWILRLPACTTTAGEHPGLRPYL